MGICAECQGTIECISNDGWVWSHFDHDNDDHEARPE